MKAGKAPAEFVESARLVRCTVCDDAKPRPREHPPEPKFQFEFNACVGMDVAEEIMLATNIPYLALCIPPLDSTWLRQSRLEVACRHLHAVPMQ